MKCPKCLNAQLDEEISDGRLRFKCPDCGLLLASKQATAVGRQDLVVQISKDCRILACRGPLNDDMFTTGEKLIGKKIEEVFISEISEPVRTCLQSALTTLDMHFFEYFVNTNRFYEIKIIHTSTSSIHTLYECRCAGKKVAVCH